jgi:RNA polymerase sigma-70 factor (ECF subfamily)
MAATDFEDLVRRHQDRLYGFALALTRAPQDAEDVVQEAFLRAQRALAGWEPSRRASLSEAAWLHRIALNVFRNRLRAERRRPTVPLEAVAEPAADGLDPSRTRELRDALARLPRRYREAVVMRHVQGLDYAEMAAVAGTPEGTLKSDVHRGLKLLKEELSEWN